jgi:hypothetical protein
MTQWKRWKFLTHLEMNYAGAHTIPSAGKQHFLIE